MRGIRTPPSTASVPASVRTVSNRAGNVPSRSRIRNPARQPASSRSMTRPFATCVTQDAVGCAAPRTRIRRPACSITAPARSRTPDKVIVSRKPHAGSTSARERGKSAHLLVARPGTGPVPAFPKDLPDRGGGHRDAQDEEFTVDAALPRLESSPANRSTGSRMEHTARGIPGRSGREHAAWQRGGARPDRRAGTARSPDAPPALPRATPARAEDGAATPPGTHGHSEGNRTSLRPSRRSSTVIRCRRARISVSSSRSLTGGRRSTANAFVTVRQASHSSTTSHHAGTIAGPARAPIPAPVLTNPRIPHTGSHPGGRGFRQGQGQPPGRDGTGAEGHGRQA
ncbi:hypothetical protein SUDANB126_06992 [Streptomyces sp. enrichment culture]